MGISFFISDSRSSYCTMHPSPSCEEYKNGFTDLMLTPEECEITLGPTRKKNTLNTIIIKS